MESTTKNGNIFANYRPLIVIVALVFLAAVSMYIATGGGMMAIMRNFMGLFLIIFSMFKLFNLEGFANGFQMYDIIAKKHRTYAYVYPFIELVLGLAFLSNLFPIFTNLLTFAVMTVSSIGVIKGVTGGMNLKCACLGTILNVPLSTVSILENVGMGLMAVAMLLYLI